MRAETAFLTGGTGYIGRALLQRLLNEGYRVKSLVREAKSSALPFSYTNLTIIKGDLNQMTALRQGVAGAQVVFHLAASLRMFEKKDELYLTNIRGTENLLQVCAETGQKVKFVFASSIEAVGPRSEKNTESHLPAKPVSDYGKSKLEAEKVIRLFCQTYPRVSYTILRMGNVYDENYGVIQEVAAILKKGGWRASLLCHALKDNSLSLIHLKDLVDILLAAARKGSAENKTYFAVGECLSVEKIISMIEPAIPSKKPSPIPLPEKAALFLWNFAMKNSKRSDFLTYLSIGGKRKFRNYEDKNVIADLGLRPRISPGFVAEEDSLC